MGERISDGGMIRMIAGLGNPGAEYENTRHNMGFMLIDEILNRLPSSRFTRDCRHESFFWKGSYAGKPLILQKPMTFMNLSGNAVGPLQRAEKILPEQILVVHDDMDLPLGRIRIRKNGSSGGHNGIKSVIENLGCESFSRLRMGIGRSERKSGTVDFVLSAFEGEDEELRKKEIQLAADAVILILKRGLQTAMNQFNSIDLTAESKEKSESENDDTKKITY